MKRISLVAFAVLCVFSASSANAIMVNLLDSHYSYDLAESVLFDDPGSGQSYYQGLTASGSSLAPFSKSVTVVPFYESKGSADLFYVYSESYSSPYVPGISGAGGHAIVTGSWTFRPVDDISGLFLDFLGSPYYTVAFFDLYDETMDLGIYSRIYYHSYWGGWYPSVFSDWEYPGSSPPDNPPQNESFLFIDQLLSKDNIYTIKMGSYAESSWDSSVRGLALRDIEAVPEPSSILMLGISLIVLKGISRKKFNKR